MFVLMQKSKCFDVFYILLHTMCICLSSIIGFIISLLNFGEGIFFPLKITFKEVVAINHIQCQLRILLLYRLDTARKRGY